jgi:RNA polymerase sigma-70 factor (ECF subfamily)
MSDVAQQRMRDMVGAHHNFIWRALRGLGVPAASADDAAQQVFWIAAQKLETIARGSERSFLFSTARGIAANFRRTRARNRELSDDEAVGGHVDHAPDPEQMASSREARAILEQILEGLDDDARAVFVLFELEGQTTAGIAELLGLPMGTVASRLRRAREDFEAAVRRFQASRGGGT